MKTPLFSIITVTLNCADAAIRTARSVRTQRLTDYEYIVKDGDSTDGTVEQLSALGIGNVVSSPDGGIYGGMNAGLALARGRYICFLNAGDVFTGPDTLTHVAQYIATADQPDFLYGNIRSLVNHPYLGMGTNQTALGRPICYPNRLGRFYLYRKMICHQAWFVKREIYARQNFDQSYRILADYSYLLDMILVRKVRYTHIPHVVAVFDGDGVSSKPSLVRDEERRAILKSIFSSYERGLYELLFRSMRFVNRAIVYRWIYPLLNEQLRGKASGF
ncbi:MAG: glycosyltransferase [Chloroflexales bacterium]|nr:glycosyltransferase [Chloroflexales bacterium]